MKFPFQDELAARGITLQDGSFKMGEGYANPYRLKLEFLVNEARVLQSNDVIKNTFAKSVFRLISNPHLHLVQQQFDDITSNHNELWVIEHIAYSVSKSKPGYRTMQIEISTPPPPFDPKALVNILKTEPNSFNQQQELRKKKAPWRSE